MNVFHMVEGVWHVLGKWSEAVLEAIRDVWGVKVVDKYHGSVTLALIGDLRPKPDDQINN